MKFPRPTIKVGCCLAIVQMKRGKGRFKKGAPIKSLRPIVTFNGAKWIASRLSFNLNNKKIPRRCASGRKETGGVKKWNGKQVLHTCNHIWCIEPKHLYLGGHKENGKDRWRDTSASKRKKFKRTMKAVCADKEYRNNMSKVTKGIPKTERTIARMRIAAKNRPPPTAATRKKMSKSAKARIARMSSSDLSRFMKYVSAGGCNSHTHRI